MHHPTAVLPGTKLEAVHELRNVIGFFVYVDGLCADGAGIIEKLQTENAKLLEVLEIARRYANTEYGESAACRVIASEIQKVFPAHGQEAQNPTT